MLILFSFSVHKYVLRVGYLVCDVIRGHMHFIARGHRVLHSLREGLIGTAEHLFRVIEI